jgi:hypothetical protein
MSTVDRNFAQPSQDHRPDGCEGPLIWHQVGEPEDAAILECATCDYIIATGNFNDEAHARTELLRSPA